MSLNYKMINVFHCLAFIQCNVENGSSEFMKKFFYCLKKEKNEKKYAFIYLFLFLFKIKERTMKN